MREQTKPAQPALTWDVPMVKRLLRSPSWLLRDPLWGAWIKQRGGLTEISAFLRRLPLSEDERALLNLLIERPDESVLRHTDQLSITRSTYFSRLSRLLESLAAYLNAWELAPPALASALPPRAVPTSHDWLAGLAVGPLGATLFLGRQQELLALRAFLTSPTGRLLTITGPGGIGKTSLALQAMREVAPLFHEGVHFVALAPLAAPQFVVPTIMQALRLSESPHQAPMDLLVAFLAKKQMALILDNVEHLSGAWSIINELIQRTDQLKVVVTSRVLLHLSGEQELRVPPLELPDLAQAPSPAHAVESSAIALFLERARLIKPDFPVTDENIALVAQICRQLDGLPLAIELAAARLRLLPLPELAERLSSRLDLLSRGFADLPERHQSLRRTMDWSYTLLSPADQLAFARLSAFSGGFALDAAARVLQSPSSTAPGQAEDSVEVLDSLTTLLDNSLLYREPGEKLRIGMLETVREYALELLAASEEAPQLRLRHARYYLDLVHHAEGLPAGTEQFAWYQQIQLEYNNVRAALDWAEESGDETLLSSLVAALKDFWWHHGYHDESQRWVETALRLCRGDEARGRIALCVAKHYRTYQQAVALAREAADYHRQQGNFDQCAWALIEAGKSLFETGAYQESEDAFLEAEQLFRRISDAPGTAHSLIHRGLLAMRFGDNRRAIALLEESLAFHEHLEEVNLQLGIIARRQGELDKARQCLTLVLERGEAIGRQQWIGYASVNLGQIAEAEGQQIQALEHILHARAAFKQLADDLGLAHVLEALVSWEERQQTPTSYRRAAQLLGAMEALRNRISTPLPPVSRDALIPLVARLREALGPQFEAEHGGGASLDVDALLETCYPGQH